ncbi:hypothetical protein LshimejAT787_0112870 [Lyophyllum shimeji]|uniref:Uncharacterized protein n=1 Tax=Lyophyllum shimeji TaxID=47721 RepID=A0A9P3UIH4_LYOSH|nr:hypothetical protein LshimejAT787_0112870 [Lyophyllum shimeji]
MTPRCTHDSYYQGATDPLWVPEPYGNSVSYRTKGVRVGDVGYVTEDGAVETLFDVRASPSDPINSRGVPEGFEQVHIPFEDIVLIPKFHQRDCTVTSATTKRRAVDLELSTPDMPTVLPGAGASLQFTWTSSHGAILHLPDGACRLACPAELFRDVAIKGAKDRYKFANETLRRGVPNGALYLVTGRDKTNSWMVGAFADKSSTTQASFKLSTSGFCDARATYSYSWETSSPAVYRTGPSPPIDSTDTLLRNRASIAQDDGIFAGDAPGGMNQCVFIRGYRIMLRTNPVALMFGGTAIVEAFVDRRYASQASVAATKAFVTNDNGNRDMEAKPNASPFHSELGIPDQEIVLDYFSAVLEPYHPSTSINELLFEMSPHAAVSLVHDDHEWGSILCQHGELEPPNEMTFLLRIFENFLCVNGTASVFLRPRYNQILASEVSQRFQEDFNGSIHSLHRGEPEGKPAKCGKRNHAAAGTEDLLWLEINSLRRDDFRGGLDVTLPAPQNALNAAARSTSRHASELFAAGT